MTSTPQNSFKTEVLRPLIENSRNDILTFVLVSKSLLFIQLIKPFT